MIANKETLKDIALRLNVHQIHLKVFLASSKNVSIDNVESEYRKQAEKNPRPFVNGLEEKDNSFDNSERTTCIRQKVLI